MKNLFILLLCLTCFNCLGQNSFLIKGNVPLDFNEQKVTLLIKDHIGRYTESSFMGKIHNGKFSLNGEIVSPAKNAALEISKGTQKFSLQFILDTGINELDIKIINPTYKILGLSGKLSLSNSIKKTTDSLMMAAYEEHKENKSVSPEEKNTLPPQLYHEVNLKILNVIKRHPDNYYALLSLNQLALKMAMIKYQAIIVKALQTFSPRLQQDELGLKIQERYEREELAKSASQIGRKMFDFNISNLDGSKPLDSKDFVNRPYVLAFSATWCGPCHEQLPTLKKLYDKYKEKGLQVIYYNTDNNFKEWGEYVKKNNLTWTNVSGKKDYNALNSRLDVNYIPAFFIISKDGTIIYNSAIMDNELDLLEEYIKKAL